jgi:hypothetical protein
MDDIRRSNPAFFRLVRMTFAGSSNAIKSVLHSDLKKFLAKTLASTFPPSSSVNCGSAIMSAIERLPSTSLIRADCAGPKPMFAFGL